GGGGGGGANGGAAGKPARFKGKQSRVRAEGIGVYAIALRAEEHNWPFYLQAGFTQSKHHDGKTFFYSLKQAEQYYKTLAKPR
nr:hypothetical protein [Vibrio vulnificus]